MSSGTKFTEADILKLQQKGLVISDPIIEAKVKKAIRVDETKKGDANKAKIEFILKSLDIEYVKEHKFLKDRKFKFDYCNPNKKWALEYEGLFAAKSGHLTVTGYTLNCNKYNLAAINGWTVLRYTAINLSNIVEDLKQLLK